MFILVFIDLFSESCWFTFSNSFNITFESIWNQNKGSFSGGLSPKVWDVTASLHQKKQNWSMTSTHPAWRGSDRQPWWAVGCLEAWTPGSGCNKQSQIIWESVQVLCFNFSKLIVHFPETGSDCFHDRSVTFNLLLSDIKTETFTGLDNPIVCLQ